MARQTCGYTLVEMVIVTAIIGVLAAIAVTRYSGAIEQGRSAEAYSVLSDIVGAEKAYFVENDVYAVNITDLHNFSSAPASDNFTFSVNTVDGYAQAARVAPGNGRLSYGMCLASSKKGVCDADTASCLSCP